MAKISLHQKTKTEPVTDREETQSLAPAPGVNNLPAVFDGDGVHVVAPSASRTPYVTFASTKSPSWAKLSVALPGLQEGDAVLVRPDPLPPVKLAPFRAHALRVHQYWAQKDAEGNVIEVSAAKPEEKGSPLVETMEAFLLVYVGGELVPARATFTRAQCQAAHVLSAALQQAARPEWGKLSPEHEKSLAAPKPFMRFAANIATGRKVSKSSGYKYNLATAAVAPTGPVEWTALGKFFSDPDSRALFDAAHDSYLRRIDDVTGGAA